MVYRQRIIFPVYLCTDRTQINLFIANTQKKKVIPFFYSIFSYLYQTVTNIILKKMEQTFKARNPKIGLWLFAIGIVACIVISFITIQAIWVGAACLGPGATIYFSQATCRYIVKENGMLQIVNGFHQKRSFNHITSITYTPHALGIQKIKIKHATGFVMVDPESPQELIKALQEVNPGMTVRNFT